MRKRKGKIQRTCEFCGVEFFVFPCELKIGSGKFCSRKCGRNGQPKIPVEIRFREKLAQPNENGCVLWTGSTNAKGYGQINLCEPRKPIHAHRLAWELANGPVPNGLCVLHRCDTPACCNPDHLFLGTKADNSLDMAIKERSAKTKLTASIVREIRLAHSSGISQRSLAKKHGMHKTTIRDIVRRKSWKHVA